MTTTQPGGPLRGVTVIELGGVGPGPFCAMLLADLGADVVRIDRPGGTASLAPIDDPRHELLHRGRRSVAVDLKHAAGAEVILHLVDRADVLIEGFRPGVAERLGVGPVICTERNPRLVYGRVTGYGQDGPWAQAAGHDIDYLAVSGVLSLIGRRDAPPTPPLSLVGDFGGGGYPLATGVLAALVERSVSGCGQVIDASMVEGAALLATPFLGFAQTGAWDTERGSNFVDSGAPYYDAYLAADGRWLAVAAIEPAFYADLVTLLGLPDDLPAQHDRAAWPAMKQMFADVIATRTRDEWVAAAEGTSACVAPVLDVDEAPRHPHNAARQSFVERDGLVQPAPAPRFSRTPATLGHLPPRPGEHTRSVLEEWTGDAERVDRWLASGAAAQA